MGMTLPIAEHTGTIEGFTQWAAELSLCTWARSERRRQGGRLVLTLHRAQLARPTLARDLRELIDRVGVRAAELVIAIPDRSGPDACRAAVDHLGPLVDGGTRLALDDHRGHGSPTQPTPNWLPSDSLVKLDPALVVAADDHFGRTILETTADGLHSRGYELIAGSIERPGQLAAVVHCHIAWAQGALLAQPVPIC